MYDIRKLLKTGYQDGMLIGCSTFVIYFSIFCSVCHVNYEAVYFHMRQNFYDKLRKIMFEEYNAPLTLPECIEITCHYFSPHFSSLSWWKYASFLVCIL